MSEITGKAAVLIIDNQTGFFGVDASVMNRLDEEIFFGLLRPRYDQVIVVKAHDRKAENNEVVAALKRAASKYGVVDMYVHMHTNMEAGTLAQVDVSAFDRGLTNEERKHLRLLYSMGCGDGNDVSAIMAQQIGFKTFLGHKGNESASPLFAYPAFSRWLDGDDWFSWFPKWLDPDDKISESASETHAEIKECLPKIGNEVIDHWGQFQKIAAATVSCSEKEKAQNADEAIACVLREVPDAEDVVLEALSTAADCMPELATIAGQHAKGVQETFGTAQWKVPDIIQSAATANQEDAGKYIREKTDLWLQSTEPFVAGADIEFDDEHPLVGGKSRKEAVQEIARVFENNKGDLEIRAVFALAQLGAESELETLARDKNFSVKKRFLAILALVEKDAKYYDLLATVLREPVDKDTVKKFEWGDGGTWTGTESSYRTIMARNVVVWNLNNDEALQRIVQGSDIDESLRVESLVKLIGHGRLSAEELKDIWYWRGQYAVIARENATIMFLQRVALGELTENHHQEAIPVMGEIFSNPDTEQSNVTNAMFEITLHHRYAFEDFSEAFYQLVIDINKFRNMCEGGNCDERLWQIYQNRRYILKYMQHDPKGRDLLIAISKRIVRESEEPLLKLAASLYLYDQQAMNEAEFKTVTGLERTTIDEEGDEFIFSTISDRHLRYSEQTGSQK